VRFPDIITRLPQAELPFPFSAVKASVIQSDQGQLIFFDIMEDLDLRPHSHKAQWGTVLEGQMQMTIGGETKIYSPGEAYFIPSGVVHSGKISAGTKIIDFFEEKDRYKLR
jgi:quercetin dioxygenase-like cupin family protein